MSKRRKAGLWKSSSEILKNTEKKKCGGFKTIFKIHRTFLFITRKALLAHTIVRGFFGDGNVMHVAFFNACTADADELGFCA